MAGKSLFTTLPEELVQLVCGHLSLHDMTQLIRAHPHFAGFKFGNQNTLLLHRDLVDRQYRALVRACQQGDLDRARTLCSYGYDVADVESHMNTQKILMCSADDTFPLTGRSRLWRPEMHWPNGYFEGSCEVNPRRAIRYGRGCHCGGDIHLTRNSLLVQAVHHDKPQMVEFLAERGIRPFELGIEVRRLRHSGHLKISLLHIARSAAMMRTLLDVDSSLPIDDESTTQYEPLLLWQLERRLPPDALAVLLEAGTRPDGSMPELGRLRQPQCCPRIPDFCSPLEAAVYFSDISSLELLLKWGAEFEYNIVWNNSDCLDGQDVARECRTSLHAFMDHLFIQDPRKADRVRPCHGKIGQNAFFLKALRVCVQYGLDMQQKYRPRERCRDENYSRPPFSDIQQGTEQTLFTHALSSPWFPYSRIRDMIYIGVDLTLPNATMYSDHLRRHKLPNVNLVVAFLIKMVGELRRSVTQPTIFCHAQMKKLNILVHIYHAHSATSVREPMYTLGQRLARVPGVADFFKVTPDVISQLMKFLGGGRRLDRHWEPNLRLLRELVEVFLAAGAPADGRDMFEGLTPLHYFFRAPIAYPFPKRHDTPGPRKGDQDAVISAYDQVMQRQENGWVIINALLDHGADIMAVDEWGRTALIMAVSSGWFHPSAQSHHSQALQARIDASRVE
ncbi:hypothetical protein C8034_v000624 [Colletotrichum sidae]|uniref:Uncharacterized protein n=1 Tax=Colletotrichum sidae TaxID=1347389 RepID=A0A4R8TFZ8_9PEZI|nr:hypothetical protein C8034_v000624 [Colletotrichum sidae]